MKQTRFLAISITGILTAVAIVMAYGNSASALTLSNTQELHVTAKVLPMRHIIIDPLGRITQITSNTKEDITPEVFAVSDKPENKLTLSASTLKAYRSYMPVGSTQIGIVDTNQAAKALALAR